MIQWQIHQWKHNRKNQAAPLQSLPSPEQTATAPTLATRLTQRAVVPRTAERSLRRRDYQSASQPVCRLENRFCSCSVIFVICWGIEFHPPPHTHTYSPSPIVPGCWFFGLFKQSYFLQINIPCPLRTLILLTGSSIPLCYYYLDSTFLQESALTHWPRLKCVLPIAPTTTDALAETTRTRVSVKSNNCGNHNDHTSNSDGSDGWRRRQSDRFACYALFRKLSFSVVCSRLHTRPRPTPILRRSARTPCRVLHATTRDPHQASSRQ